MQRKLLKKRKSSFREKVCEAVRRIPKGEVLTYKRVAVLAGKPKAFRAVGNILNKNKDFKIPCHRVVKSDGRIGGYNLGLRRKASLLEKEGVLIKNRRVVL